MTTQEYNICVQTHTDGIYRFILKNIKDEFEAENIVQNTYEKLWIRKDKIEFKTAKPYLFKMAYHEMIDSIRKQKNRVSFDDIGEIAAEEELYNNTMEVVKKAMNRLPEKQKNVLLLRDYEGYDYRSIGKIMDLSDSQVKVYIFRARKTIKAYLQKLDVLVL